MTLNGLLKFTLFYSMIKKANQRLFMLRSTKKFGFDHDELLTVCKSFVRPIIEYGDVVWHSGLTTKQSNNLEKNQKRACKTILGIKYNSFHIVRLLTPVGSVLYMTEGMITIEMLLLV